MYPNKIMHSISVVIPVYNGEHVIENTVEELINAYGIKSANVSANKNVFAVEEIILVHDCGPDQSAKCLLDLEKNNPDFVKCIWLTRNFGQHGATLAGISNSQAYWIVTMDEDGQHDPVYIPKMLDVALTENAKLVFASPVNNAPHGRTRNSASKFTKIIVGKLLDSNEFSNFSSYRFLLGAPARELASRVGSGVYLDVALTWIFQKASSCDVVLRGESRPSGYKFSTLIKHFLRLLVTSGTKPLRLFAYLGVTTAFIGFSFSAYILWMKFVHNISVAGWTSVMVAILISSGLILTTLGVISEFLGTLLKMSMGKPAFFEHRSNKNN